MPAVLFGSISTLADTSEVQRQAFNDAFDAHDLGWRWDRDEYLGLLEKSGGRQRIADYAAGRGQDVDATAVHATKSQLFRKSLTETHLTPRPGVVDTIQRARAKGYRVALVTTTTPENVAALLSAVAPDVRREDFDVVLDTTQVDAPKPDPAAYLTALRALDVPADQAVAVEDNLGGVGSATGAGLRVVAFPNENTAGHRFDGAVATVDTVSFDQIDGLLTR